MSDGVLLFLAMVFATVFFLSQGLVVPVFGEGGKMRKRLKQRLKDLDEEEDDEIASLLRDKYLDSLAPWERTLESLRLLEPLRRMIDQAGHTILAYRLILICLAVAFVSGQVAWYFTHMLLAVAGAMIVGGGIPIFKIWRDRTLRMEKFEEQLKEAIINSGMSQSELAELSGVTQGQLSHFLADGESHRGLAMSSASKIAEVLGLELRPIKKRK